MGLHCSPSRGRRATAIGKGKVAFAIATIAAIRASIVALLICKLSLPFGVLRAAGNSGPTDRDLWKSHGRIAHLLAEAARFFMGRRRRRSCRLIWRDCCSTQVWRDCRSAETNSVPSSVRPEFPDVDHMEKGDPQ